MIRSVNERPTAAGRNNWAYVREQCTRHGQQSSVWMLHAPQQRFVARTMGYHSFSSLFSHWPSPQRWHDLFWWKRVRESDARVVSQTLPFPIQIIIRMHRSRIFDSWNMCATCSDRDAVYLNFVEDENECEKNMVFLVILQWVNWIDWHHSNCDRG